MNHAAIVAALWPTLRRFLMIIGRWLMRVIVDEGARFLIGYMRQRIRVFKRRLERVLKRRHAEWRPRFLRGRIDRWSRAVVWLEHNAASFRKRVVRALSAKLDDSIPEDSPYESESAWRRLQKAS